MVPLKVHTLSLPSKFWVSFRRANLFLVSDSVTAIPELAKSFFFLNTKFLSELLTNLMIIGFFPELPVFEGRGCAMSMKSL